MVLNYLAKFKLVSNSAEQDLSLATPVPVEAPDNFGIQNRWKCPKGFLPEDSAGGFRGTSPAPVLVWSS